MSDLLGIDYGTKRVGVAVASTLGPRPLEVLARADEVALFGRIAALVAEHEIARVVVGVPYRLSGRTGPEAERALDFARRLAARLSVPVTTRDETLSTAAAYERMRARGLTPAEQKRWVDAYAAVVLLEDELSERRDGGRDVSD